MKKKFSFLMATILACALSTNVWADVTWTDYTSKLTNPSFETGDPMSDPKTGYQTECKGWTLAPSSASNSQMGIVATGATIQGVATSLTAPAGSQYFYIRNNWNNDTNYNITQTISNTSTLPVGMYKLTCKMITYSGNWSTCSHTVSLAESGGQTSTKTMYSTGTNWTDVTVLLYKASDTSDLTIKANLRAGSSGSGQHYQLIVDDFQLSYCEDLGATQSSSVDVTDYISNPSIQNTNKGYVPRGWTAGSRQVGNSNYTAGTEDTQLEAWSGGNMYFDYYQTLNGLPEGLYQLSAKCHDSNAKGGKLYATAGSTTKSTSMTTDYSIITTEKISVSDGTLKIGMMTATTSGGSWMTGDDFTLCYLGYDASEALAALKNQYEEAEKITGKMSTTAYANLTNTISAAKKLVDAGTGTKAQINTASTQLTEAVNAANASIADYANLKAELDLANVYNVVQPEYTDLSTAIETAQGHYNDADVDDCTETINTLETARQAANVGDYNYRQSNYTISKSLGSWTNSNFGTTSGQSYTGSSDSYYDKWNPTALSPSLSQTITLPKGDYILVGIGRGQANASTAKLFVTIGIETTEVPFYCKNDVGLGVDTDGAANFSNEGTYANDNKGRGWEYRYIKFSLTEETSVTIGASAAINNSWASVYAPQLFGSTADAKAILLSEIQSSLTTAKSIKDSKMNETVRDNLNNAITTANDVNEDYELSDIQSAHDGLNTAITDANTSINNYSSINAALTTYNTKAENLETAAKEQYTKAVQSISNGYTNGTIVDGGTEVADIKAAYIAAVKVQTGTDVNMTEVLVNPSFEEGAPKADETQNGWTTVRNTTGNFDYRLDQTNPAEGSNLLNAWAPQVNYINVWQKVTLHAGTYTLSAKARTNAEPLENKTQVRTYINNKEASHSAGLTYTADETAWNAASKWITLTTTFSILEDTEVEMGIYSTGKNIANNQQGWFQVDDFQLIRNGAAPTAYTRTVNTENLGTLCVPYAFEKPGYMTLYNIVGKDENYIYYSENESDIVAGTPYLFTSTQDNIVLTYSGAPTSTAGSKNGLVGTFDGCTITKGNGDYVLSSNQLYIVGNADFTLGANRAYIHLDGITGGKPAETKGFTLSFDEATGISNVDATSTGSATDVIYNLAGQRVNKLQKGINIVNGKKVLY